MNMFNNLSTENMEEAQDVVGGAFDPVPTDIYDASVKLAYAGESTNGAKNVTLVLDVNGREVKETIYVTNRKGEPFYVDKTTKKNMPLPGFSLIDDLCLFTTEAPLSATNMEEKTVKVYDPEQKKEVNKPVPVLVDLLTKPVKVAIQREIVDKTKQGDDGQYHPTGETRTQNAIVKFMHPETGRTVNEYKHEIEDPIYMTEWKERWAGKDRNRASKTSNTAGSSGSGRPGVSGGGNDKPAAKSLFGGK